MTKPIATLIDTDWGTYSLESDECGAVMLHHYMDPDRIGTLATIPLPLATLLSLAEQAKRATGCETVQQAAMFDAMLDQAPVQIGARVISLAHVARVRGRA